MTCMLKHTPAVNYFVAIIANPFQFKSKWQTDVLLPLNAHSTLRFDRRNEIVAAQEISTPASAALISCAKARITSGRRLDMQ
jgi:hypothetical protein